MKVKHSGIFLEHLSLLYTNPYIFQSDFVILASVIYQARNVQYNL